MSLSGAVYSAKRWPWIRAADLSRRRRESPATRRTRPISVYGIAILFADSRARQRGSS
jgi:hypothetical protein